MSGKVWKISCLWIFVLSMSTNMANGACTPTPDCASIGYTETSCEGNFVRCPFDISKLLCLPCDSKYQYDCNGANMTSGVGISCNSKYVSCTCSNGRTFNNGACPQSCTVGMIYYSDKSCSDEVDASKTAIGVVVKDNELIASIDIQYQTWSSDYIDVDRVTNYTSMSDAETDYNGKANTLAIVSAYSGERASLNAAIYCNSYSTAGTSAGDWYLPAAGEIYEYFYGGGTNYSKIRATWTKLGITLTNTYFWSSSEYSRRIAWIVDSFYNDALYKDKYSNFSVSCLLAIN